MNKICFLIISLLISCSKNTSEPQVEILKADPKIDEIKKVDYSKTKDENSKSITIPENVDFKFETFLNYFSNDSTFQLNRVNFPLKVKELDFESLELIEKTITQKNYHLKKFTYSKINRTEVFENFTQKITVSENTATIEISGVENGIAVKYNFVKTEGEWKLTTWINQST